MNGNRWKLSNPCVFSAGSCGGLDAGHRFFVDHALYAQCHGPLLMTNRRKITGPAAEPGPPHLTRSPISPAFGTDQGAQPAETAGSAEPKTGLSPPGASLPQLPYPDPGSGGEILSGLRVSRDRSARSSSDAFSRRPDLQARGSSSPTENNSANPDPRRLVP